LSKRIFLQLAAILSIGCSGCSRAPSVNVLGSFFPAWMICVLLGVAASGLSHWLLVRLKLEKDIFAPVLFFPSVVVAVSCLLWLLLFR
jgi:hypothetical protein